MGTEILYRMRYLICFIFISLLAFGFTFYFVSEVKLSSNDPDTPAHGITYMF